MTVCDHTGLTKPECHCPRCMAAMIAAHAPASSAPTQAAAIRGPVEFTPHAVSRQAA